MKTSAQISNRCLLDFVIAQALNLRVYLWHKFDNEILRQIGKEAGDVARGVVVTERKVVHQCQRARMLSEEMKNLESQITESGRSIARKVSKSSWRGPFCCKQ